MRITRTYGTWITAGGATAAAVLIGITARSAVAYERYTDGCDVCHGNFDDGTSLKGTIFPDNSKHEMHRALTAMATDCLLCHVEEGDNPQIDMSGSDGFGGSPGPGCNGCHALEYPGVGFKGFGLRRHHALNNVAECVECHTDDLPPQPESTLPSYYTSADTNVSDSCNLPPAFGENFSIGDTLGLDNDGDQQYDENDADCGGCPWDCGDPADGSVGVVDFLAVLAQWGEKAGSCDVGAGGPGVGVSEFLELLANWGPCV